MKALTLFHSAMAHVAQSKPLCLRSCGRRGNVEGADVILVDDLIDTGGTITRAAEVIMNKGAKSVRAICTHPILSGSAYENIEKSVLTEMLVSDTIPLSKETSKIKVLTVADLFAKAIYQIQNDASVSSLFL